MTKGSARRRLAELAIETGISVPELMETPPDMIQAMIDVLEDRASERRRSKLRSKLKRKVQS